MAVKRSERVGGRRQSADLALPSLQSAAKAKERPALRIRTILVPIDFSQRSKKALRYAVALARQFGGELVCLHVIDIPYGAGEAGLVVEMQAYRKHLQAESRRALTELVREEAREIPVTSLLRAGAPYHEITRAAREFPADLIVISTHGRIGVRRFVLGSTAERVVRHAPCPVLVVRERERDFMDAPEPPKQQRLKRRE